MARGKKRRVCIVIGSRRDHTNLQWILHELKGDKSCELQIIAVDPGHHHSTPLSLLAKDAFTADAVVPARMHSRRDSEFAAAMDKTLSRFRDAIRTLNPDILLLTGHGNESLAAALGAAGEGLQVAYLHEIVNDDPSIVSAITEIASVHFVQIAARKIPGKRAVFVGSPLLDFIKNRPLLSKKDFEKSVGIPLGNKAIYLDDRGDDPKRTALLLRALESTNASVLLARISFRPETEESIRRMKEFVQNDPARRAVLQMTGRFHRFSALKHVDAAIGFSNSLAIEAAITKTPMLFIGVPNVEGSNLIPAAPTFPAIEKALTKVLSKRFSDSVAKSPHLYGTGNPSAKIAKALIKP